MSFLLAVGPTAGVVEVDVEGVVGIFEAEEHLGPEIKLLLVGFCCCCWFFCWKPEDTGGFRLEVLLPEPEILAALLVEALDCAFFFW